jgi:hypothetical protein
MTYNTDPVYFLKDDCFTTFVLTDEDEIKTIETKKHDGHTRKY